MKYDGPNLRATASDLAGHLACRHLTQLDLGVARGELEAPERADPRLAILRERGARHEESYLRHLRRSGMSVRVLDPQRTIEASIAATTEAMRAGVDAIAQATLGNDVWYGRADVLLRVDGASHLGEWSYEVVETKLATTTRGGTLLQLCVYSNLVGALQGREPEGMHVVVPRSPGSDPEVDDLVTESYRFAEFGAYFRAIRRRFDQSLAPAPGHATYPHPTVHCEICRWWRECRVQRLRDDHLSLVAGMGRLQEQTLRSWNVATVGALGAFPLPLPRPERGSIETYGRLREQARLQVISRQRGEVAFEALPFEEGRGLALLPEPSPGDVFLDLEAARYAGAGGLDYLFGVMVDGEDGPSYACSWALTAQREKIAFQKLVDDLMERWERFPDFHVYHFGHAERSALERLMGRHATREDEVDRLLRGERLVDLLRVVRQGVRVGVESYSLKHLEELYGFRRSLPAEQAPRLLVTVAGALELGRPDDVTPDLQEKLALYNRDDCASAAALRGWLEWLRQRKVDEGASVPRPTLREGAPGETLDARRREIEELTNRLLAGLPPDAESRTDEQRAQFLLANLVDWVRREKKSTWWEKYRLGDATDEERLEERSALSGLTFAGRVGGTDACPIDRYRFPPQEIDRRSPDDEIHIDARSVLGKLVELRIGDRLLDVKKRRDTRDLHPASVFFHRDVRAEVIELALQRFGGWVADHGIGSPRPAHRAARDLLLGRPPKVGEAGGEPLLRPTEAPGEAAVRVVLTMEGGVLPIQGPPGAGKTHTAARMIVGLVKAGRKVGVTALSHKVIRHLLEEVIGAGREAGVSIRCIQKVREKQDGSDLPEIQEVNDNGEIVEALRSGDVPIAAGTAWLWSRPEMESAVDALFIDEAGQFSLAHTLAVSHAAARLVLVGDPQQLEQPTQGAHPEGTDVSALAHLLQGAQTLLPDRGLFLNETYRLHPAICAFTSEQFYEGRLRSREGLARQRLTAPAPFDSSGLYFLAVDHEGNQTSSEEEAQAISNLVESWLRAGTSWTDKDGVVRPLGLTDILFVAPYNAQVAELTDRLPAGASVGTVDKFQGQQAPVVFYSLTSSAAEEAPHGLDFLYSRNRLNVASSRARCACVLVASPRLLEAECRTPHQMRLVNALCRYVEMARVVAAT